MRQIPHVYRPYSVSELNPWVFTDTTNDASIGRGQPMHLPRGHALPIRSSHAVQERRVQNGAQGRGAGDPHEHRGSGRRHAVVLDVPLSTGGVRRVQGDSARTGRIEGQDRGGIGDGGEGVDN